jgi:hypothetical protein
LKFTIRRGDAQEKIQRRLTRRSGIRPNAATDFALLLGELFGFAVIDPRSNDV